jgi:hypothetical protein
MPRVRLVAEVRASQNPQADLGSVDIRATALIPRQIELSPGPPGTAELLVDDPGRAVILTRAPARRLLVFSESWHHGWRVTVDGMRAEAIPAYGDFLACVVGPGERRVEFTFRPGSYVWGRRLTLAGVTVAALWAAALCWRRCRGLFTGRRAGQTDILGTR